MSFQPPFFGTSLRRDAGEPRDLHARIDAQLRERVEEAVDFVCLEAMVERRRARGLAAPRPDDPRDREEFARSVLAFLRRLEAAMTPALGQASRERLEAAGRGPGDEGARLLAAQAVLARELADYWQRFEASRAAFRAETRAASGREGRRRLGRLFGG